MSGVDFTVGQRVGWADWVSKDYFIRKTYGDGPFEVVGVTTVVRPKCNCGARTDCCLHMPACPAGRPDKIGHHQMVIIRLTNGCESVLSGKWFKPISG